MSNIFASLYILITLSFTVVEEANSQVVCNKLFATSEDQLVSILTGFEQYSSLSLSEQNLVVESLSAINNLAFSRSNASSLRGLTVNNLKRLVSNLTIYNKKEFLGVLLMALNLSRRAAIRGSLLPRQVLLKEREAMLEKNKIDPKWALVSRYADFSELTTEPFTNKLKLKAHSYIELNGEKISFLAPKKSISSKLASSSVSLLKNLTGTTKRSDRKVEGHESLFSGIVRLRDGRLLSYDSYGFMIFWRLDSQNKPKTLEYIDPLKDLNLSFEGAATIGVDGLSGILEHPDGRLFLYGANRKITVLSKQTNEWVVTAVLGNRATNTNKNKSVGHTAPVRNAKFLPDGRLVSIAEENRILIWKEGLEGWKIDVVLADYTDGGVSMGGHAYPLRNFYIEGTAIYSLAIEGVVASSPNSVERFKWDLVELSLEGVEK